MASKHHYGSLPVLIGTCNRYEHFRKLVQSLARCYGAADLDLYVALDAPFSPEVTKENKKILKFCNQKHGFKKVTILKRKRNLGPTKNFESALKKIFLTYPAAIILEDDNVVSKNFLLYMNQASRYFWEDRNCLGISAYSVTTKSKRFLTDIYRDFYYSGWGVVHFRGRGPSAFSGRSVLPDPVFLSASKLIKCLRIAPHIFRIYMEGFLQGRTHGDIQFSIYALKHRGYFVHPVNTKTINHGLDGSGVRCGRDSMDLPTAMRNQNQKKFFLCPDTMADMYYRDVYTKWHLKNQRIRRYRIFTLYLKYLYHSLRGIVRIFTNNTFCS